MALHGVVVADEQDLPATADLGPQPIAGADPGGGHGGFRDRDLVLGADRGAPGCGGRTSLLQAASVKNTGGSTSR